MIGLFVYFRRGSAHKARHFYVLCLASFIFFCFHYTGKLNGFDKVIYFGNVAAGLLAPTVFLHFCLTFPEPRKWFRSRRARALLYLPGAAAVPGLPGGRLRRADDRRSRCSRCAGCSTGSGWCSATAAVPDSARLLCSSEYRKRRRSHRPPAAQVAAQRHLLRHPAVRRCSTSCPTPLGAIPNTTRRCRCCRWC